MREKDDGADWEEYQKWKGRIDDRRKWERYPPGAGVLARLDGYTYKLLDIGLGGLSLYNHGGKALPEEGALSLHCQEEGFYLDTLRYRKVSEYHFLAWSKFGRVNIHKISLMLMDTDPDMGSRLAPFMRKKEGET
jgi:hypothetical protein